MREFPIFHPSTSKTNYAWIIRLRLLLDLLRDREGGQNPQLLLPLSLSLFLLLLSATEGKGLQRLKIKSVENKKYITKVFC